MSRKVWYCATCGYEVNSRGRCHACGERLLPSPLEELELGEESSEIGYRLDQWDDETRSDLIQALIANLIHHRFEEEDLVVRARDEEKVDALVAEVTGSSFASSGSDGTLGASGEIGPEEGVEDVIRLYNALSRLRDDPTDMQADLEVGEASAGVFVLDGVAGLDEDSWAAVGRVTRRLLGALGAEAALDDEIRHHSEILCRLLAPVADASEAEDERARTRLVAAAVDLGRSPDLPEEEGAGRKKHQSAPDRSASIDLGEKTIGLTGDASDQELTDEDEEDEALAKEVVYELEEWLPDQKIELTLLMEAAGIAHEWDESDLIVPSQLEDEVDSLFDQVEGLVEDDDEIRYRSIEELFAAAHRLGRDPEDDQSRHEFLEASAAAEAPTPVGVDDSVWWRVRSQTHSVISEIESKGRPDEISRDSESLAELLRGLI